MRTIYVDEKVEVWRRTRYEVSDDLTNEELIDKLRDLSKTGEAFEIEDEEGVNYVDGEYLSDTEESYSGYGTSIEVFDSEFNSLDIW
jgi:hypothetical protein